MSHSMRLRSTGRVTPIDDEPAGPEMPGDFLPSSSPLSELPPFVSDTQEIPSTPVGRRRSLSYSDAVAGRVPRVSAAARDDVPPLGDDYLETPYSGSQRKSGSDTEPLVTTPRPTHARRNSIDSLSSSQAATVRLATANLSSNERDVIHRRNTSVFLDNKSDSDESEPERKAKLINKGKGVDPKNWGNIQLPDEEADTDLQAALQASLKTQRDLNKTGESSRTHHEPNGYPDLMLKKELEDLRAEFEALKLEKSSKRMRQRATSKSANERVAVKIASTTKDRFGSAPVNRLPVPVDGDGDSSSSSSDIGSEGDILPSAHIAKNSALGVAFKGLNGRRIDSSSSSSSSSDDSSSSPSNEAAAPMMIKRRKRQRSRSKRTKKNKRKETKLKPVPPVVYKGEPELVTFQRFVSESISYIEDGNVPRRDEVRIISRFTDGPAQRFVQRRVFGHWQDWTLESFFRGLFDEVFPANFTERQRWKLKNCRQREGTSVREYIAELTEILSSIGEISERDQVVALWHGLRASIRAELYRKHLSPDKSSWKKVAFEAEIQEIAEAVMGGHNRNNQASSNGRSAPSSAQPQRNDRGSGSGNRTRFHPQNMQRSNEGNTSGPQRNDRRSDRSRNWSSNRDNASQNAGGSSNYNNNRPSQPRSQPGSGAKEPIDPRRKYNLSQKEMDDLKVDKKCFYCRETGHVARQCPRAHSMSSSSNRRPPGLRSNNIDIDFDRAERLLSEARDSEVLHTMELGMVDIGNTVSESDDGGMPGLDDCSDDESEYDFVESDAGISDFELDEPEPFEEVYVRPDTPIPNASIPTPSRRATVEDCDDSDDDDENMPPLIEISDDDEDLADAADMGPCTRQEYRDDDWAVLMLNFLETEKGLSADDEEEPIILTEEELDVLDAEFDAWCMVHNNELVGKEDIHMERSPKDETPQERLWHQHQDWYREACHTNDRLGDGVSNTFMRLMEDLKFLPFPGDQHFPKDHELEPRFGMVTVNDDTYALYDFLQWKNLQPEISRDTLLSPGFSLAKWYIEALAKLHNEDLDPVKYEFLGHLPVIEDPWLNNALSYLQYYEVRDARANGREHAGHFGRWHISKCSANGWYTISDSLLSCKTHIHCDLLMNHDLNLGRWYEARMAERLRMMEPTTWEGVADLRVLFYPDEGCMERALSKMAEELVTHRTVPMLTLHGVQVERGTYPAVERNAAIAKDHTRLIPRPLVITVNVEGHPCRALLDSGSLGDFVSSTLVTQLKLKKHELKKSLPLQLAVQGSCSKINFSY